MIVNGSSKPGSSMRESVLTYCAFNIRETYYNNEKQNKKPQHF
jgi:hypothetical protein